MELNSIKCPNCGSSQIINDVCKHCGSVLTKPQEEISKPLTLTVSGMSNFVIVKKGKNNQSIVKVSGMNQEEEIVCKTLNLKISGMNNVIKVDKDIEILDKTSSESNNKVIRI